MKPLYTEVEFRTARCKTMLPLECMQCKGVFYRDKTQIRRILNPREQGRGRSGDFCSLRCTSLYHTPPILVPCMRCGESFRKKPKEVKKSPHHFCGSSCAALYNNAHKTTGTRVSKLEKWIQARLLELHPTWDFHFNRKDAINSELDIYIPHLRLAFELNGIFHYEPIYGPEKLAAIQNNDERKFQACVEKGIELCLIDTSGMINFKEARAQKFLDIIRGVIDKKSV